MDIHTKFQPQTEKNNPRVQKKKFHIETIKLSLESRFEVSGYQPSQYWPTY